MIELHGARILVTGASGFLASALASRLQSVQCTVVQATRPGRHPAPLAGRENSIHVTGDVSERSFWTRTLQSVDVVFHFAAQTSVYVADDNPPDDWRANVQPMLHLLETCREQNCRPAIVFAGSVTEVGLVDSLPVDETVRDRPVTV